MKFSGALCAALSEWSSSSNLGALDCDKLHLSLTQPIRCQYNCFPLSHHFPSQNTSATPRRMALQEGLFDTDFAWLPQRRGSHWICSSLHRSALDAVGIHTLLIRVQTTHLSSLSVGGSRYYFWELCKPPQIKCTLLIIYKQCYAFTVCFVFFF